MSTSQLAAVVSLFLAGFVICAAPPESTISAKKQSVDDPKVASAVSRPKVLVSGKVVFWREALKQRGVTAFEEFDKLAVLETDNGQLLPIVPDWRGRAFFQDKRLRNRKVELVGYRRPETSTFQVLMVFTFDERGTRQYTDYWCDICSIPMYEIKPCDCCQADIRLRYQPQGLPEYITRPNEK